MRKLQRIVALCISLCLIFAITGCANQQTGNDGKPKSTENQNIINGNAEIADTSTDAKLVNGKTVSLPTLYYQQFGASPEKGDHSAETLGGWHKADIKLNLEKTAIVIMHAAYLGTPEQAPEQFSYCEYIPRSYRIAEENFSPILDAARAAGVKVYHVPFGAGYFENLPGYQYTQSLNAEAPYAPRDRATADDVLTELYTFKDNNVAPGPNAWDGIIASRKAYLDFLPQAKPQANEPIATTANELAAIAVKDGINHFIYMGFAIDACLLSAPGGMVDMQGRGFMCSAITDAVTAVESRESVQNGLHTEAAYWRISVNYGFLYDSKDLISAINLIKK